MTIMTQPQRDLNSLTNLWQYCSIPWRYFGIWLCRKSIDGLKVTVLLGALFVIQNHLLLAQNKRISTSEQSLLIAEAYQAESNGNTAKAAQIAFDLVSDPNLTWRDPYLILGDIHLDKGLYETARYYYETGAEKETPFLIHENRIRFYYHFSASYYYTRNPQKQLETLNTLVQESQSLPGRYADGILAQTHLLLALVYWGLEEKGRSLPHINALLETGLDAIPAYILLAYYYASTPQDRIDLDYDRNLRGGRDPGEADLARAPQRDAAFRFHDQKLLVAVENEPLTEKSYQRIRAYSPLITVINDYRKELNLQERARRQLDFEYLESLNRFNENLRAPNDPNVPNASIDFNAPNGPIDSLTPENNPTRLNDVEDTYKTTRPNRVGQRSPLRERRQRERQATATSQQIPSRNQQATQTQQPNQAGRSEQTLTNERNIFNERIQRLYETYDQPVFLGRSQK